MDPKEEGCRRIQEEWSNVTPEKITEDQLQYYKSISDPKELEVVPIDILRNRFLNYDSFIDHLRDVKKEV